MRKAHVPTMYSVELPIRCSVPQGEMNSDVLAWLGNPWYDPTLLRPKQAEAQADGDLEGLAWLWLKPGIFLWDRNWVQDSVLCQRRYSK